jgi:hypothetical protein
MKLKEPISTLGCHYINSLDENEVIDRIYKEKGGYTHAESLKYVRSVKRFCAECVKSASDGSPVVLVPQTYRPAKDRMDGRFFVSMGLQNIARPIRSLLCRDTSTDYDMVNAHPTLLLYLASVEGIVAPYLKRYVDHREDFLNENGVEKLDVIKMINTDQLTKLTTTEGLIHLGDDINKIREVLYAKNKGPSSERYNKKSSVLNHLLCTHEHLLLQRCLDRYSVSKVHALCFDGFLYDSENPIDVADLDRLTADYGIRWTIKDMDKTIEIPESFEPPSTYAAIKQQFEQTHCFLRTPVCILEQGAYGDRLMTRGETDLVCATYEVDDVFTIKKWIRDKSRREYQKMDFLPYVKEDTCPKGVYNTFRPFAAKYVQKEDRHPETGAYYDHLLVNLCDKEEGPARWLHKTFAWRFQFPDRLPGVGIIFRGLQGGGKDASKQRACTLDTEYLSRHRWRRRCSLMGSFNFILTLFALCDLLIILYIQS